MAKASKKPIKTAKGEKKKKKRKVRTLAPAAVTQVSVAYMPTGGFPGTFNANVTAEVIINDLFEELVGAPSLRVTDDDGNVVVNDTPMLLAVAPMYQVFLGAGSFHAGEAYLFEVTANYKIKGLKTSGSTIKTP